MGQLCGMMSELMSEPMRGLRPRGEGRGGYGRYPVFSTYRTVKNHTLCFLHFKTIT